MDHFHPVIPGTEAKWRHGLSLSEEEEEEEGTRSVCSHLFIIRSFIVSLYRTQFPIMPHHP